MSDLPPIDDPGRRRSVRSADGPDKNSQQALYVMLAKIWERSQKNVVEQVEVLEQARVLAVDSKLDEAGRLRAVEAAHKLAGVLGTFGLPRGTELARVAEQAFGKPKGMSHRELERVGAALDELSSLVKTPDPLRASC